MADVIYILGKAKKPGRTIAQARLYHTAYTFAKRCRAANAENAAELARKRAVEKAKTALIVSTSLKDIDDAKKIISELTTG